MKLNETGFKERIKRKNNLVGHFYLKSKWQKMSKKEKKE